MRRAAKSDANQPKIIEDLRHYYGDNISICDTHRLGDGFPDIVVGIDNWINLMFEIKTTLGRMTKDELKFLGQWKGQYQVIRSTEQAIYVIDRAILLTDIIKEMSRK